VYEKGINMKQVVWVNQWIQSRLSKNQWLKKEIHQDQWSFNQVMALELPVLREILQTTQKSFGFLFIGIPSMLWMGTTLHLQWDLLDQLKQYPEFAERAQWLGVEMAGLGLLLAVLANVVGHECWKNVRLMMNHKRLTKWLWKGSPSSRLELVEAVQVNFAPLNESIMAQYQSTWFECMDSEEGQRWQEFYQTYGYYPALMKVWLEKKAQEVNRGSWVELQGGLEGLSPEKEGVSVAVEEKVGVYQGKN